MLENKIKDYINSGHDARKIARWLLNTHIHKFVPLSLNDISDTSIVAEETDAIEEAIIEKDFKGAVNIAEEGAINILEDEGFDL